MAFGITAALHRRATEGGTWLVRASLAGTARWLRGLGRVPGGFAAPGLGEVALERSATPFGMVEAVPHAVRMTLTLARWNLPPAPLGTHEATWP